MLGGWSFSTYFTPAPRQFSEPELFIQLELTLTYYLITKGEMLGGGLLNAYEAPGSKELGALVIA